MHVIHSHIHVDHQRHAGMNVLRMLLPARNGFGSILDDISQSPASGLKFHQVN
jgi:hypothetical protein